MKLITIVKNLQNAGVDIKYRIRKDGGILVTEVDGMRFSGAYGNSFIRSMTGESLSEAQIKQRQKIKPPKKVAPMARKKADVPENVKRQIAKLQRLYRKDEKNGKPTIKNWRYVKEKYGEQEANRLLQQSEYYVRGIAYTENIKALIQRLEQLANIITASGSDASQIYDLIDAVRDERDNHREDFTEEKLKYLLDQIYSFEAEWNLYQQGADSEYSDEDQIISSFAVNFATTLRARYSRRKSNK